MSGISAVSPPIERDARRAADLCRALDELGDLLELDARSRRRSRAASSGSAPQVMTSLMQCAARSAPQLRSAAAGARDHQLRPDAVGRGGEQPPLVQRVEAREGAEALARRSTRLRRAAARRPLRRSRARPRRRRTCGLRAVTDASLRRGSPSDEQLAEELRPALRAAATNATTVLADLARGVRRGSASRSLRERVRLARGSSASSCSSASRSSSPLARAARRSTRAADASRAGSRRSWRRTSAGRRAPGRAGSTASARREHRLELVLVEREPEVVDARHRPLARLDDDVHRAALELGEPQLEARRVELLPRRPRARPRRAPRRSRPWRATRSKPSLPM